MFTILQRRRELDLKPFHGGRNTHILHSCGDVFCHGHGERCLCVLWHDVSRRPNERHLGARLGGELKDVVESFADLHFLHVFLVPPFGLFLPLLHRTLLGFHLVLSFRPSASRCVGPNWLCVFFANRTSDFQVLTALMTFSPTSCKSAADSIAASCANSSSAWTKRPWWVAERTSRC